MNTRLFENHYNILRGILNSSIKVLGEKELKYRTDKLERVYSKMIKENKIEDEFFSLSHEIRAIDLLHRIGKIRIAQDSQNEAGVDITFKDRYKIECIICTTGTGNNYKNLIKSGYQEYNKIFDYNEKFRQITLRFTSAIKEKKEKLDSYLNDGHIMSVDPYCIFINLGSLSQEWFPGKLCSETTRILVGRGYPQITIDKSTGKQVGGHSFSFIATIKNNNNSEIDTNIFANAQYAGISSVIVTSADLSEFYNSKNTVIFMNPKANNKIKISDFDKMPYWKINNKSEYVPRIKGKKQIIKTW